MRIAKIREQDIANGPGIRVSIYVQGCTRHCDGCFNPETWDFDGGHKFTLPLMMQIAELGSKKYITGYSILGGEPLQQDEELITLLKHLRKTKKSIWMWTGYKWENLTEEQLEIVKHVDVLVDGPFIDKLKNPNIRFRGSSNQRIIDVKKTLRKGTVVLDKLFN